jgi:hypothetical protein
MGDFTTRPATGNDEAFRRNMLYEALLVHAGESRPYLWVA